MRSWKPGGQDRKCNLSVLSV